MDNEKRFFLAISLTLGFLYVWYTFMAPPAVVNSKEGISQVAPSNEGGKVETSTAIAPNVNVKNSNETMAKPSPEMAAPEAPLVEAWSKNIENDKAKFLFNNQAGSLSSATLKAFKKDVKKDDRIVLGNKNLPLSHLSFSSTNEQRWSDENLNYEVLEATDKKIHFVQNISDNIKVEKIYTWSDQKYAFTQELIIHNTSEQDMTLQGHLHIRGEINPEKSKGSLFAPAPQGNQALAYILEDTERWPLENFTDTAPQRGDVEWAGWDSQYFMYAAIPQKGRFETLSLKKLNETSGELKLSYPSWDLKAGDSKKLSLAWYAGPKDIEVLETIHPNLDKSINLGSWLGVIARPLLRLLKWIHGFVPNYGWAIILLTFLVRLLLFPLTQMQAKSMKRMQMHKPQLDALKEKFGDDKEGHSRAMMKYMRDNKINPAGGCLPLLPQLPIFFALYRVLYNSIELRHAPFMAWIQDLSVHDPLYVLPVVLGGAMFVQQKLTPTPGTDPAQQAMMKFMPIMFSVFMIFLPSGLNLYILVSTLWGIAQQYWIHKSPATV